MMSVIINCHTQEAILELLVVQGLDTAYLDKENAASAESELQCMA